MFVNREKPGDEDWTSLDKEKIPFLLNYSQCHLLLGNYYAVIEHTTEVITKDPGAVIFGQIPPSHSVMLCYACKTYQSLAVIKCLV